MIPRPGLRVGFLVACVAACGGGTDGEPAPAPLDLSGARVMLVPARSAAPPELDRELAFWLGERAPGTLWVAPDELTRAVNRTPGSRFQLDAPRRVIELGGGERRIADPLYGDLRRLGALLNVELALVPLETRERTDSAGVVVELRAALVSVRGGRVPWLHTVTGGPASTRSAALTEAAEALARSLIRSGTPTDAGPETGGRR